ncbi:MAG: glycosyltransferase family 2 protein [Candidatus Poribacteria bacterium]|nr:glycosyltransferase family 2 protein [Candidatus Poribacteria bacterium]
MSNSQKNDREKVDLSIVIPVFNEEENLHDLYSRLTDALSKLKESYEIIFIDDGSTDLSFEILRKMAQTHTNIHAIRFRRNFGQTAAMSAGFDYACGEVIVPMDADLQNDPFDVERLLEKLDDGYDIVSGWRANRQDGFFLRRIPSILANRLISWMTGVYLHDFGCTLKAYRREILENINLYGELHRFIPAFAKLIGARMAEIKVRHHPRARGKSKYGISRTIRVILDLITVKFLMSYSTRPIQIFGLFGLIFFLSGICICGYLSIGKLFFPAGVESGILSYLYAATGERGFSLIERMPMLILGVLLLFTGIQFITMGLIGELVIRTYHESQKKPIYVIRDII